MASLLPGEQSHLGSPVVLGPLPVPPPPRFANFRFNTIGQEPELLKRISVPGPDFQYNDDRASPTPSLQYPSQTPEPSRSRPSLLQALTKPNHADTDMPDVVDEMSIDSSLGQQTEAQIDGTKVIQFPSTTGSTIPHNPQSWSARFNDSIAKPVLTRARSPAPLNTPEQNPANTKFQEVSHVFSNAINHPIFLDTPSSAPVTASNLDADGSVDPPNRPSPPLSAQESHYMSLRALQVRLMSALENLHIPDNSDTLLLVQAAHTHSTNALSTAHRSHVISQQAVAAASEAVTAAQESLNAAEKAKAHASDAVIAVEQMGGARGSKSKWEWMSIISGLQSDLRKLGEWIGEREGEDAAKRQEMKRIEGAKRDEASVDSAMRVVGGSLSPQAVQVLVDEVVRRTREEEARSRSMSTGVVQTSLLIQQQQLHRTAELEADDARRAWSLEHGHPVKPIVTTEAELRQQTSLDEAREQESQRAEESAALIKQAKLKEEIQKREEDAHLQQEQREAEVRAQRVRELELQKLEVAKFRMLERERQALQETERNAADAFHMRQEAEQRVLKEAEVAEARRVTKAQVLRVQLEEQAKKAAALKAETIACEEAVKKEAEARAAEARAADLKAVEEKAAEEQAAARAAEAREIELREAQSKKRQEVMAQKQRASAETAARILAERAREKNEKSTSPVQPQISPKALTHPLPSPVFQSLPLPPLQTSGQHEPQESQGRAVSGGIRLGTSEESSTPPSPCLSRSTTVGLRPQKEGRSIPLPLPLPRLKVKHDKTEGSTSGRANSSPVTPLMRFSELPDSRSNSNLASEKLSVHRRSQDSGNLPMIAKSQLLPTSPEAQAANLRFMRRGKGFSQDTHLKPDPVTVSVKFEPLAEAKLLSPPLGATKRKITEQAGPALPKRPKVRQDSIVNMKSDKEIQLPAVPSTPVPASTPPAVVPRISPSIQTSTDNGSNILPSNATPITPLPQTITYSLTTTAPIPPRLKPTLPNFRTRKPIGSSVETPTTTHNNTSVHPTSKFTHQTNNSPRVSLIESQVLRERSLCNVITSLNKSTPVPASSRSNTTHPELNTEPNLNRATTSNTYNAMTSIPQRSTPEIYRESASTWNSYTPAMNRETTLNPDEDGANQIAPAIRGDGGWDAPSQGDEELYDVSFSRRDASSRYTSRNSHHYSPPARTPPRSLSPALRHSPPNPQEIHRGTNSNYASGPSRRPALHISTIPPVPRARTPPLRILSPPPTRSPYLGKRRRWIADEPPSHRYWQGDGQRDRTDRSFRSHSTDTPPPTRPNRRSPTPERFGGLHSRIGARDAEVYAVGGGQSYRPSYPSDSYSSQPRWISDSYQPSEFAYSGYEQDSGSGRAPLPGYDRYVPVGRPEVAERPDLLERMNTGAPTRGRIAGPFRGSSRGRGRGGRPLEQRISSNQNTKPMTLMNRLEA